MPLDLRPSLDTDGDHLIATFGGKHYVFEGAISGVLKWSYTETIHGEASDYKPRKNVLAYLEDIGYDVQRW